MAKQDQTPLPSARDWVAEHAERYAATNGEDGYLWRGYPTLILDTIGRRSGQPRRQMLIFGEDEGNPVIVASKGGADEHPFWYSNLVANPEVQVQIKDEQFTARARTTTAEERSRLWALMAAIYPPYIEYQEKTSREIPVVVLERV